MAINAAGITHAQRALVSRPDARPYSITPTIMAKTPVALCWITCSCASGRIQRCTQNAALSGTTLTNVSQGPL